MLLIAVGGLLALLVMELLIYPLWMHRQRISRSPSREELKRIEDEIEQEILTLRKHADKSMP